MLWVAVAKFCSISRMKVSAAFFAGELSSLGTNAVLRAEGVTHPVAFHLRNTAAFLNLMEEGTMTTVLAIPPRANRNRRGWSLRRADVRKQVYRESHA
jgi:hypothetical protein